MKIAEKLKTKTTETFSAALVVVLIIILSMLGPVAMFVGSAIGLVAYTFLSRERLRNRGWLKVVIPVMAAGALGAAIAISLS
jgi:hypothetical protein